MSYLIFNKNKLAKTILDLVDEASKKAAKNVDFGGTLTFDGQTYQTNFGYFVSNMSPSLVVPLESFDIERIISFLNFAEIQGLSKNSFIGIWFESISGKIFLDISNHVITKKDAIKIGRQNFQISIFCNKTQSVIYLK